MDPLTDAQLVDTLKAVTPEERERLVSYLTDEVVAMVEALNSIFDTKEGLERNLARLDLVVAHRRFSQALRKELL